MVKTASSRTASNEGSDGPHDVVETGDDTTMGRVRDFDDVDGAGGGGDRNTETKEETASHELVDTGGDVAGELDNDTDDDDRGTDCHAGSSAPGIDGGTNKGDSYDGTNLVHGGDDTGFDTSSAHVKELLELRVGEESSKEGAIETVGGRAAEGDGTGDQKDGGGKSGRRLLEHGLLEGLITNGRLLGCDDMLSVVLLVVLFAVDGGPHG